MIKTILNQAVNMEYFKCIVITRQPDLPAESSQKNALLKWNTQLSDC